MKNLIGLCFLRRLRLVERISSDKESTYKKTSPDPISTMLGHLSETIVKEVREDEEKVIVKVKTLNYADFLCNNSL